MVLALLYDTHLTILALAALFVTSYLLMFWLLYDLVTIVLLESSLDLTSTWTIPSASR